MYLILRPRFETSIVCVNGLNAREFSESLKSSVQHSLLSERLFSPRFLYFMRNAERFTPVRVSTFLSSSWILKGFTRYFSSGGERANGSSAQGSFSMNRNF